MVSPNERNPVIRLAQPAGDLVVDQLVISGLLKAEPAVPCDNQECVREPVLDAQFEHDALEVAVDVAAHDDTLLLSSYDFTGFVRVYSTEFQCLILEPVNFFLVLNYLVFNEHGNA